MKDTTKFAAVNPKLNINVATRIDSNQFKYLKQIAKENDRPISYVIRSCIAKAMEEKWLDK